MHIPENDFNHQAVTDEHDEIQSYDSDLLNNSSTSSLLEESSRNFSLSHNKKSYSEFNANPLYKNLLHLFNTRKDFYLTFSGIKRLLKNVHQQKLTNALEKLVDAQIIERTEYGYRLNSLSNAKNTQVTMKNTLIESELFNFPSLKQSTVFFEIFNPPADFSSFSNTLRGKWFGKWRYIGHYVTIKVTILEWMIEETQSFLRLYLTDKKPQIRLVFLDTTTKDQKNAENFFINAFKKNNWYFRKKYVNELNSQINAAAN